MPSSPKPWSFSTYTDADGRTYVYGYRNRWDPEKKQSRIEKRCHVGRLDPQTGQVHLGRKFLTNNPEYAGKFWLYDLKTVESTLSQIRRRRARGTSGLWPSSP